MSRAAWSSCVPLACLLLAASAGATGTAEVTRAQGTLLKWASSMSSPIPDCYISWQHVASEGPSFHAVLEDYFPGDICDGEFMVHCGADTLAFTGWWPEGDVSQFFLGASVRVTLRIDLLVTAPTTVTASRHRTGDLAISDHDVTLITAGGESILLEATDAPADKAQLVLAPGTHEIRIDVHVYTGRRRFPAYTGDVTVVWEDASTSAQATTWGTLKATYR